MPQSEETLLSTWATVPGRSGWLLLGLSHQQQHRILILGPWCERFTGRGLRSPTIPTKTDMTESANCSPQTNLAAMDSTNLSRYLTLGQPRHSVRRGTSSQWSTPIRKTALQPLHS